MSQPPLLHYGRQWITDEDIEAVVQTLRSSNLTQGPKVAEFERELAAFCGARHAVAVNSATSALHIACLAADLKAGDEAITSPNTFVASSNCVLYCNAKPVFADILPETANVDPAQVEAKVTSATRALIPVHFGGQVCEMTKIQAIAKAAEKKSGNRVYVIEDASQALGSTYRGSKIGAGAHSDMTVLSFHPVKHITTGEGGAVLTNDTALYRRLLMLRSHGITRDLDMLEDTSSQPWGYEQHLLGFNYRLTDVQSALGIAQLKKLPSFIERRRLIANRYRKAFAETPEIGMLRESEAGATNPHLFVVLMDFDRMGGRSQVMNRLKDRGLITQVHYIPVHTQPYYRKHLHSAWGDFPLAEAYYRKCLSIPIFPAMSDSDVERVISEFQQVARSGK